MHLDPLGFRGFRGFFWEAASRGRASQRGRGMGGASLVWARGRGTRPELLADPSSPSHPPVLPSRLSCHYMCGSHAGLLTKWGGKKEESPAGPACSGGWSKTIETG
jgi:hypothetical protein